MVTTNCSQTENDPEIRAFLDAVKTVTAGNPLKFHDLQTMELMSYVGNLCILRRNEESRDLSCILWGSQLAECYGRDLTGKDFTEGEFGYAEEILVKLTHEVIDEGKSVFTSGTVDWHDRDHLHWRMVTLPLISQHGDDVSEALFCTFWNR